MVDPDNLVLEHLRAMRSDMAKMMDWIQSIGAEVTSIRHHVHGIMTIQEQDHADIAAIKVRLDRIETRLDLVH